MESIFSAGDSGLMPTYGRFDIELDHGAGAVAVDTQGREYIDFGSGIGVNALGYCEPGWVKAVTEQAGRLQHISNLYDNPVQTAFARELCAAAGMARVFLCNSGAEANECAIKLARKYSFDRYGEGRSTVLTLQNSFHGRTVTTLAATGQDDFHRFFYPFTGGFRYLPANDLDAVKQSMDGTVCAVMLECVQGEGGVLPLDFDYLRGARELCTARDILLIIDEVQTGAGRTGRFLACEHAGIRPDVVTMAKGLGGGLPIGACLCAETFGNVLSAGTHGSTFGGNPVACAAGRYMLSRLTDPAFLREVEEKGAYLRSRLQAMPHVTEVQGLGMMLGAALDAADAKEVASQCVRKGLLVLTAKTRLRFLPPLNITREDMDRGLERLEAVLSAL